MNPTVCSFGARPIGEPDQHHQVAERDAQLEKLASEARASSRELEAAAITDKKVEQELRTENERLRTENATN